MRKQFFKIIFLFIALLANISPAWATKDFYIKNNTQTYFYVNGTSGNIGIGSLTPGQILDVQGTIRTTGFTMSGQTPVSGYVLTASDSAGDTTWTSAGAVSGWTVTGNNVYETLGGNVGIGTTTINQGTALAVTNGNVGIGTWTTAGGSLIIQKGNVGIGSVNPGQLLDVQGTARMTGFDLTTGANAGFVMVGSSIGLGTWMNMSTLPLATVNFANTNDVTYYSNTNTFSGGSGFQTNGTNVGIGTSGFTQASLQVVGNIGIGTVANGDNYILTSPPKGGMIVEGNVGIGTWAPTKPLSVTGDTYYNGNIGVGTSLTTTSAMTVMNGNVGIGTWVPAASLQVVGIGTTVSGSGLSVLAGNVGIGTVALGGALQLAPYINSTAAAGAVEFDGTSFYATSAASSRQVMQTAQFIDEGTAGFTLTNGNATQQAFGGGTTNGSLTLQGNTTYFFEGQYLIASGGTNHTTAMGFAAGNGLTFTSINYSVLEFAPTGTDAIVAATESSWVNQAAVTVVSNNVGNGFQVLTFTGSMRINAGGTITPQIKFSAAPGAPNTMSTDSYFRVWPIGSSSVQTQGSWS